MGSKLAQYINKHISGNVYNDKEVLAAYATDKSILKIQPKLVAMPDNTEDVRKLLNFVNQLSERGFKMPVAVRGSGLDKTGADLTEGMVISTERMDEVIEIDSRSRMVHVQAGVTLGKLNAVLKSRGLYLPIGIDPRETIGGLIANAPTDTLAAKYGGIMNYVDRIEVVLPSGDRMQLAAATEAEIQRLGREDKKALKVYRNVRNELRNYAEEVKNLATVPDSAGYAGAPYVERNGNVDLSALMYGSQGTLAVITEVILRVALLPAKRRRVMVKFSTVRTAQKLLDEILAMGPESLEIYDVRILARAEELGKNFAELGLGSKAEGYVAVAEFAGGQRALKRIMRLIARSQNLAKGNKLTIENAENRRLFGLIESARRAYLNDGEDRAGMLDGAYVPNKKLVDFVNGLEKIEKEHKVEMALYGSYAAENYNVRPALKLAAPEGRKAAVMLLSDYSNLVREQGGSLTGGTPEGRVKAMVTNHRLTEREKKFFQEIKEVFDPNGIMNPDIKGGANTRSTVAKLREEKLLGENS